MFSNQSDAPTSFVKMKEIIPGEIFNFFLAKGIGNSLE